MKADRRQEYLRTYGAQAGRPLIASSVEGIEQAVVIPVLAERSSLFRTLASIARNPSRDLLSTLVICVVNNKQPHLVTREEICDNQITLQLLSGLSSASRDSSIYPADLREAIGEIRRSDLRLACIDASSPGRELPEKGGGVGTARKIGMDAALGLMVPEATGVICCLDADTLVRENYLTALRSHFEKTADVAAVTAYAHQTAVDRRLLAAICCYEIFLRSYVLGLSYAASPYAFHAIGSTVACTADGYVGVRGMNRRTAAEDFHFLDKLAKIGSVGVVTGTIVFPSPRASRRVPFGTGQRILRFLTAEADEYRIYDPRIFVVLKEWLAAVEANPDRDSETILSEARRIHVSLEEYLRQIRMDRYWESIRKNCGDVRHLTHQFRVWFDGLKTLRMVHHFSRAVFPLVPMFAGLADLLDLFGVHWSPVKSSGVIPELDVQWAILEALRSQFPAS